MNCPTTMLQVVWLYGHNHKVTVGSDPKEYDQIQQKRITVYLYIYLYQYAIIYIYSHIIPKNGSDQIFVLPPFFLFSPCSCCTGKTPRRSWCGGVSWGGATKNPLMLVIPNWWWMRESPNQKITETFRWRNHSVIV